MEKFEVLTSVLRGLREGGALEHFVLVGSWCLIVAGLREEPSKAEKDLEAAHGLLLFFEDRPAHLERLREIYGSFPRKWQRKISEVLRETDAALAGAILPSPTA